jgi:hypothetical protein
MSRSLRSQQVFEETEEVDAVIVVSENSVTGGGEKQETLQQTKETELFGKILEMMDEEKKSKGEVLNRLEVLNERFNEKLELEKLQRSKDVFILREETQHSVNGKLNKLSSSMYTSLELQKPETRQIQSEMSKKLDDYKNEAESKICNIQSEFAKFRQDLIVDSFSVLEEKLEAKMNEMFDVKLKKLESQLEKLSGIVSAVCGDYYRPSVDNEWSQEHNIGDSHSSLLPTFVPPAVTSCQGNCKSNNNETEHVVTECEGIEANIGSKVNCTKIGTLVGGVKCHSSVMGDLTLPEFSDCQSQYIVNFLEELDSYFQLKAVPVEMKLPLAIKSVTDEYVRQWVTAMVHRNGDDSLSAHFLRFATMAANLTPKMSELEVIDAICGHYPNYIQRALLSANIRTIQQSLNFFSKLQIMEDGEANMSSSHENVVSRSGHDSSASQNQSRNYRQGPQPKLAL